MLLSLFRGQGGCTEVLREAESGYQAGGSLLLPSAPSGSALLHYVPAVAGGCGSTSAQPERVLEADAYRLRLHVSALTQDSFPFAYWQKAVFRKTGQIPRVHGNLQAGPGGRTFLGHKHGHVCTQPSTPAH